MNIVRVVKQIVTIAVKGLAGDATRDSRVLGREPSKAV